MELRTPRPRWQLVAELINQNQCKVVAEIGVDYCHIGKYVYANCPSVEKYICVDLVRHTDREVPVFIKDPRTVYHQMYSSSAHVLVPDDSLDFLYIDANHEYPGVCEDIQLWVPKVKIGGIIAGHDFSVYHPGAVAAVSEYFDCFSIEQDSTIERPTYSWWLTKERERYDTRKSSSST